MFSFRNLWKKSSDSQFSDLFTELPVPPQAAGVVGTFKSVAFDTIDYDNLFYIL